MGLYGIITSPLETLLDGILTTIQWSHSGVIVGRTVVVYAFIQYVSRRCNIIAKNDRNCG